MCWSATKVRRAARRGPGARRGPRGPGGPAGWRPPRRRGWPGTCSFSGQLICGVEISLRETALSPALVTLAALLSGRRRARALPPEPRRRGELRGGGGGGVGREGPPRPLRVSGSPRRGSGGREPARGPSPPFVSLSLRSVAWRPGSVSVHFWG